MLDPWRDPERGVRIEVRDWIVLDHITDQYIERLHSPRTLLNYVRHIGIRAVLLKVMSRLAESQRNRKVVAVGRGLVIEAPDDAFKRGDEVIFLAPNHAEDSSRVVVDRDLVSPVGGVPPDEPPPECLALATGAVAGWSPFSGSMPNPAQIRTLLAHCRQKVCPGGEAGAAFGSTGNDRRPVRERVRHASSSRYPRAVLFGLGNYAKTQIAPNLRRHLNLCCVHEIDPLQLAFAAKWGTDLDTSPFPRDSEEYDVWYVAGYHHTHADIAVHAMRAGAYAVVEKPLATTWDQLHALEATLREQPRSTLMTCFQRRFTVMNDWTYEDLGVSLGTPIHYHSIVYEIPLPRRHWYNWPSSRSRLTSNGCHWIDHFLFLNGFPEITQSSIFRSSTGDIVVSLEAANQATFSMVLTHHGSERLGVRDHVELRAGPVTVTMRDQSEYVAESSSRILRRKRVNPVESYRRMYARSVDMVKTRAAGEDLDSLMSTRATLELEDRLAAEAERAPAESHPRRECAPAEPLDVRSTSGKPS